MLASRRTAEQEARLRLPCVALTHTVQCFLESILDLLATMSKSSSLVVIGLLSFPTKISRLLDISLSPKVQPERAPL